MRESNLEVLTVDGSTENTTVELTQSVKLTTGFISLGTGTSREFLRTRRIHLSRDRDQQRFLANMPTAYWFVGTTYFEACVLQCVCVCDVVSLSTGGIKQVSVAISLTLKADCFTLEL